MVTGNEWQSVEKWTSLWVEPSNRSPSALWRTPWINPWFVRRHSLNLKRCPQLKRQVSSSVHISLLICRVFDYWNINTTTWAIWKHILVGNFVLKEHLVILRSFPTRTGPGTTCASAGLNADWIQATYQHTEKAQWPMLSNVWGIFLLAQF